jgi:hypothetical protein
MNSELEVKDLERKLREKDDEIFWLKQDKYLLKFFYYFCLMLFILLLVINLLPNSHGAH